MTSADLPSNTRSRTTGIPIWVKIALLSGLLIAAVVGLTCVDIFFEDTAFKNGSYGVCSVVGAIAIGLLLLRVDEFRQIRRWNTWRCANCAKHYRLRSLGEVKFWGNKQGKRAGVLLVCSECQKETAFDLNGSARSRKR